MPLKSLWQTIELWKGAGLKCRAGKAPKRLSLGMTSESVCVCFYKVLPCYMNPFRSFAHFCYRPLPQPRPLLPVCLNSKSAVVWLMTNLSTKSCPSVWIHFEVMHFFCNGPLPLPRPLQVNWHEHKHTFSHTFDLCSKFQPPGAKTVAATERGIFGDRLIVQPTARAVDHS